MKIIEIIVSPAGDTRVETKGFAGASCRDATRGLERALGIRQSEQTTPEYHQTAPQSIDHRQQLGG